MATYPVSPSLPAVTGTTDVDAAFLNTLVDNINAMADDLISLSDNDGNIDLAADKGIEWGSALKIYFSGGDIIIDDGVVISGDLDISGTLGVSSMALTGGLDVPGTLTVDTIDDSGAGYLRVNTDARILQRLEVRYSQSADAGVVLSDEGTATSFLEILQSATPPADPTNYGFRLYTDTSGNINAKMNEGGVTIARTLMPYAPAAYAVTNDLTDRTYDANTVAVAELADVVGTIIADLQALGLLG